MAKKRNKIQERRARLLIWLGTVIPKGMKMSVQFMGVNLISILNEGLWRFWKRSLVRPV